MGGHRSRDHYPHSQRHESRVRQSVPLPTVPGAPVLMPGAPLPIPGAPLPMAAPLPADPEPPPAAPLPAELGTLGGPELLEAPPLAALGARGGPLPADEPPPEAIGVAVLSLHPMTVAQNTAKTEIPIKRRMDVPRAKQVVYNSHTDPPVIMPLRE